MGAVLLDTVSGFAFEFVAALLGVLIAVLGRAWLQGWLRRAAVALGGLLVLTALLSTVLNVGFQMRWGTSQPSVAYEGEWLATPNLESDASWLPTATPFVVENRSPTSTLGPTVTQEPTASATSTPTSTPTGTPTPTPTPTPIEPRQRLEYARQEDRVHALYIEDLATKEQKVIYTERSLIPVYSAAWSAEGDQILAALRWYESEAQHGAKLSSYDVAGGVWNDLYVLDMVVPERQMGNALWAPDGNSIALYLQQGTESGVYTLNADGTGLERLQHSEPGEWPRYWSVDGEWLVTIAQDGRLYALEVRGARRMPLEALGQFDLFDERYEPWRTITSARCDAIEESWWKCK